MQVAAADAGGGDPHQGVGGVLDDRVGDVLDPDVACLVHERCAHGMVLLRFVDMCQCVGTGSAIA